MIKYKTEERPFTALKPGDLVGMSWGYSRLERVVREDEDGSFTLYCQGQPPVNFDSANWRDVAIGYSDEYQKAYPEEVFGWTVVYRFPNGFREQAVSMWGWLNHGNFSTQWAKTTDGSHAILIPDGQVAGLLTLQQSNPATWGTSLCQGGRV